MNNPNDKPVIDIRSIQRYHEICQRYGGYLVEPVDASVCGDYMKSDDVIAFIEKMGFSVRSEENNYKFEPPQD